MTVGELMVELGRHSTLSEVKMEIKGIEYEITGIDTLTTANLAQKVLLTEYPVQLPRNASHFSGGETYANNNNSDG